MAGCKDNQASEEAVLELSFEDQRQQQQQQEEEEQQQRQRYQRRREQARTRLKRVQKTMIMAVFGVSLMTTGLIFGVVFGVRKARQSKPEEDRAYPDYTRLEYSLVEEISGRSFFDHFDYFTEDDPTGGFVEYVNGSMAKRLNLTYASEALAILRVDTLTPYAPDGRRSVRIYSKNSYDDGLFLFDVVHTPYGCGTWPALWMTDELNWPRNGEIDVMEANNLAAEGNVISLHSSRGCTMDVDRLQLGRSSGVECAVNKGQAGCSVIGDKDTYGREFNSLGGGVYALEIRSAGIRTWFFARGSLPADIVTASKHPDPTQWAVLPLADFPSTHCDIRTHFRNQSIIVNIDLCGEQGAAPQFYDDMYFCPGSCEGFVAANADLLVEAYWEFRSFRVFRARGWD